MQFQTLQDYKNIEALNEEVYHEYGMEVSPIQFQHMLKLALAMEYCDSYARDNNPQLSKRLSGFSRDMCQVCKNTGYLPKYYVKRHEDLRHAMDYSRKDLSFPLKDV